MHDIYKITDTRGRFRLQIAGINVISGTPACITIRSQFEYGNWSMLQNSYCYYSYCYYVRIDIITPIKPFQCISCPLKPVTEAGYNKIADK